MVDDNIINNSKDILEHITSFYHSLSTNTDKEANTFYRHSKGNSTTQKLNKRKLDEYLYTEEIKVTPTQASLPCNSPITPPEVIQTLKDKYKPGKAPGIDTLQLKSFKHASPLLPQLPKTFFFRIHTLRMAKHKHKVAPQRR
jgi:hypothetical protein